MTARNAVPVFGAIASPTRRTLLGALAGGERSVNVLVARTHITQSAVSQQLAILRSAGLVAERREGRFRYYRLCVRPLRRVDAWLARFRAQLEGQLDALGQVLDTMDDEPASPTGPRRP